MKYKRTFKEPFLGQYITFEEDTDTSYTFGEMVEMFFLAILFVIKHLLICALLGALGLGFLYLMAELC
jgi:hypothetical protein